MFFELIATFVAGVAAAGAVMLLNRVLRGRLHKWLMPVAAGAAMIISTISNEYGWYSRTSSTLPEGIVISQSIEKRVFFRPWSYVFPYVDRFVAVDLHSVRKNELQPDQRLADLLFYGRWAAIQKVPVAVDCADLKRAQIIDGLSFGEDGAIEDVDWVTVDRDDMVLSTICES